MTIIHSDREGFTNFDNVLSVMLSGRFVHAEMVNVNKRLIGVYADADRAAEVFADMLCKLFPQDDEEIVSDKIMPFISNYQDMDEDFPVFELMPQWYYMPEE